MGKREKEAKVTFEPSGKTVRVPVGKSVWEAAQLLGLAVEGPCGGRGICGKCRIIARGALSDLTEAEKGHLSPQDLEAGYRLACQVVLRGEAHVEVLWAASLLAGSLLEKGESISLPLDPNVCKRYLELPEPSLTDQSSDLERLKQALPAEEELGVGIDLLRELPGALRGSDFRVTVVTVGKEIVAVEEGDTRGQNYGIAFDVGTTTVVGYLLDLATGKQLAVGSLLNPQVIYGDDVLSRLTYLSEKREGLGKLQEAIASGLNDITGEVVGKVGIPRERVYEVTIAGNTCMLHVVLGIDPRNLGPSPFVPVLKKSLTVSAAEIGLHLPRARVLSLPHVAGYVGADVAAGLVASGLPEKEGVNLYIDIGTNGEIILGTGGKLFACSAAAGPAFEGARISCGMRASLGAIDRVSVGEELVCNTIGNKPPRGICGSALVDLVAGLVRSGVIEATGRMLAPGEGDLPPGLGGRIQKGKAGPRFLLVGDGEGGKGEALYLTQRDVRELQLAKGAIRAGIEILLKKANVGEQEIAGIYLAGGFGNYLRAESALGIGLVPAVSPGSIYSVGNAAGEGAKLSLISGEARRRAAEIAGKIEHLELGSWPEFQEEFAQAMFFPSP